MKELPILWPEPPMDAGNGVQEVAEEGTMATMIELEIAVKG